MPGSPKGQIAEGSAEKQLVRIRSNAFSLLYDDSVGGGCYFPPPPPSTLFDFVDLLETDKEHEVGQVGK